MTVIKDMELKGTDSAYVVGPFDEALTALGEQGYALISLEKNAGLRMQEGKDSLVSQTGNWVKEGALYIPGKGGFITKNSPILDDPQSATQAHRNSKEYFITDEQVQRALESSVQVPYIQSEVPTKRFGEEGITNLVFGKNAKDHGLFLQDAGIIAMPLKFYSEDYVKGQGKPFANQLWVGGLGFGSELDGHWSLGSANWSRGIK